MIPKATSGKYEDIFTTYTFYENVGNGGNAFLCYFDSISYYLKEKQPAPETKYVTLQ